MNIREILAINLRRLRHQRGLSQEELAHQAKVDRTYIGALERSVYAAGIDVVDRGLRAFLASKLLILSQGQQSAASKRKMRI